MRFSSLFSLTRSERPDDARTPSLDDARTAFHAAPAAAAPLRGDRPLAPARADFPGFEDDLDQRVRLVGEW